MNRSKFAEHLQQAILHAFQEFLEQHPGESPYAFAIIEGQCGNYLGYAIATEEGLERVAAHYDEGGYRYQGFDWEKEVDNPKILTTWLRWSNPDDGWHYGDFSERFEVSQHLETLVESEAFGEDADELEEFCTEVLTALQSDRAWRQAVGTNEVVVGVTAGEDPRDFLRTATRCNPYSVVEQLWWEFWKADEISRDIKSTG